MKLLRLLLRVLVVAAFLLLVAGLIVLIPGVQTSLAQTALNQHAGVEANLGSMTAGFGRLDLEDSHVTINGARLDIPSLQATGPVLESLLSHRPRVRSLIAKGWTLDLTKATGALFAPKDAGDARRTLLVLLGGLSTWRLPLDGSYDGLELEGDVLIPGKGDAPARVHVSLTGGGLSDASTGSFIVDLGASGLGSLVHSVTLHGKLELAPLGPKQAGRARLGADVVLSGSSSKNDVSFSMDAGVGQENGVDGYTLALRRGARTLADLHATYSGASGVEGTWLVELTEPDVSPFFPSSTLPASTASATGSFTWNPAQDSVHAAGRARFKARELDAFWPSLSPLNGAAIDASFDLVAEGATLHVDALSLGAEVRGGSLRLRTVQPFTFDAAHASYAFKEPLSDVLVVSGHAIPIDLLGLGGGRVSFPSGRLDADFVIRAKEQGFVVRLDSPVRVRELSIAYGETTVLESVGFSAPATLEVSPMGWRASLGPANVTVGAAKAASVQWSGSSAPAKDAASPTSTSSGRVEADLGALGLARAAKQLSPFGSKLKVDFTCASTDQLVIDANTTLSGGPAGACVTAAMHLSVDQDGDLTLKAPLKVTALGRSSEVAAEGDVTFDHTGTVLDVNVTSDSADAQHLELLAGSLATGAAQGPFWGRLRGQVAFSFQHLLLGADSYEGVGGNLRLLDDQIRLDRGRVWLLNHNLGKLDMTVAYAPDKSPAYTLSGSGSVDDVDAVAVFGAAKKGELPPVEGRLAFDASFSSAGRDVDELWAKRSVLVHVKSPSGIFRVLKTSVAEAIPEAETPVADTLSSVGSSFGMIFGLKKGFHQSGANKVSKQADAIINFTYDISEIGYDQLAATLAWRPDGSVQVDAFTLNCPEARLVATGRFAPAEGLAFGRKPMTLDVALSLKGDTVKLLASSGLLEDKPDGDGYSAFKQHFLFTGTLLEPDCSQWHDLLVKAATQKDPPKKG